MKNTPTDRFYGLFQFIFEFYNSNLFDNAIKDCVIVITRKKNVAGHFSYKRWFNTVEKETDELALNPTMFIKYPLIEICQTIVHEMCHGWQYHYGTPSRSGYHNKEWADKMIAVGLMPSDTGKEGGKSVGQRMSDYPMKGGRFLEVSEELMNSDVFSELFLEVNPKIAELLNPDEPLYDQVKGLTISQVGAKPKGPVKAKYTCSCSMVWGRPNLELTCNLCGEVLERVN